MKVAMTHRNILPAASALATTRKGKRTRRDTRLLTSRASDVLDAGHVPALRIHDKGANPRHADAEFLVLDALETSIAPVPPLRMPVNLLSTFIRRVSVSTLTSYVMLRSLASARQ